MAYKASDILDRINDVCNSSTSFVTRAFFYALGSHLSSSIDNILSELEKTIQHTARARAKVRLETKKVGLTGCVMDQMVQKRLDANFDWQTWVAALAKLEVES